MINSFLDAELALDALDIYTPGNAGEGCVLYGFVMRDSIRRESYTVTKYRKHFLVFWSLPNQDWQHSSELSLMEAIHFVFTNRVFFNNAEKFRAFICAPHVVAHIPTLFGASHEG